MPISATEMNLVRLMAQAAERGGRSDIRTGDDRMTALKEDQIVGQLGTIAGHKYYYGHTAEYLKGRHMANIYPDQGDGGSDIIGANIDFKASLARSTNRQLHEYNLVVRQRDLVPGRIFILVLVTSDESLTTARAVTTHLMGWATTDMFPSVPNSDGPLKGAYCIRADALMQLMPTQWLWVEQAIQARRF